MKNKFLPEDIQTKTFSLEIKGYKIEEVNTFLDQIQEDYFFFLEEIENLTQLNQELKINNEQLNRNQANLEEQNAWLDQQRIQITKNELSNSDVMARISQIEKNVNKILQSIGDLKN